MDERTKAIVNKVLMLVSCLRHELHCSASKHVRKPAHRDTQNYCGGTKRDQPPKHFVISRGSLLPGSEGNAIK